MGTGRYTLDYPVVHMHAGMQRVSWFEQKNDPDGNLISRKDYNCHGVTFELGVWFIHFKIVFTPIAILVKKES